MSFLFVSAPTLTSQDIREYIGISLYVVFARSRIMCRIHILGSSVQEVFLRRLKGKYSRHSPISYQRLHRKRHAQFITYGTSAITLGRTLLFQLEIPTLAEGDYLYFIGYVTSAIKLLATYPIQNIQVIFHVYFYMRSAKSYNYCPSFDVELIPIWQCLGDVFGLIFDFLHILDKKRIKYVLAYLKQFKFRRIQIKISFLSWSHRRV